MKNLKLVCHFCFLCAFSPLSKSSFMCVYDLRAFVLVVLLREISWVFYVKISSPYMEIWVLCSFIIVRCVLYMCTFLLTILSFSICISFFPIDLLLGRKILFSRQSLHDS